MALSKSTSTTINLAVPSAAAGIVAYMFLKQKKDWRFILVAAAITWLILYIICSQITKTVRTEGPAQLPTGSDCDAYDPTALITAIYKDCTVPWYSISTRDEASYNTLLGLTDCQALKAYNLWNTTYYADAGYTLPGMIAQQSHFFDSEFEGLQASIANKFLVLGAQ